MPGDDLSHLLSDHVSSSRRHVFLPLFCSDVPEMMTSLKDADMLGAR
jgi:hypothetical protein